MAAPVVERVLGAADLNSGSGAPPPPNKPRKAGRSPLRVVGVSTTHSTSCGVVQAPPMLRGASTASRTRDSAAQAAHSSRVGTRLQGSIPRPRAQNGDHRPGSCQSWALAPVAPLSRQILGRRAPPRPAAVLAAPARALGFRAGRRTCSPPAVRRRPGAATCAPTKRPTVKAARAVATGQPRKMSCCWPWRP